MKCVTHQIILKGKNASHTLDVKKLTHIHTQIYTLNRWNESEEILCAVENESMRLP